MLKDKKLDECTRMHIERELESEQNLLIDERVTSKLTPAEIAECFDVSTYLKNVDAIFAKF